MAGDDVPPVRLPVEGYIDLHTFPPREVPALVGDFLQESADAGFREVRIVHGKGSGVLRETVRAVLARDPLVLSFADAPPEAGGWGATIVKLKSGETPTSGR